MKFKHKGGNKFMPHYTRKFGPLQKAFREEISLYQAIFNRTEQEFKSAKKLHFYIFKRLPSYHTYMQKSYSRKLSILNKSVFS